MAEQVKLDGPLASDPWPVELACSLLSDPSPWGEKAWWPGLPRDDQPTRYDDFNRLALQVNAYARHPARTAWHHPLQDKNFEQIYTSYSTQDLLDTLFLATRRNRYVDGLIHVNEPQLRLILQEIVRRVQSADPPQFVVDIYQDGAI